MAGILSRFASIMEANINDLLDRCEDPAKMVDQQLRDLRENLAEVQESTKQVMAERDRCQRVVNDYQSKIDKCVETAQKALRAGNEEDAKTMIAKKQDLEAQKATAQKTLEVATANADRMRKMHDKLVSDISVCESRRNNVKSTAAMAKAQQNVNKAMSRISTDAKTSEAFNRMEEKAQRQLDEAMAEAELIEGAEDPTAAIEKKYAGATDSSVEDELSAMKAEMGL